MTESTTTAQLENVLEFPTMTDRQLAEYVRGKLNLALSLACHGEQERRSCHWQSAEAYQRQWEEVMSEVKRLLPLVRKSGVPVFDSQKSPPLR